MKNLLIRKVAQVDGERLEAAVVQVLLHLQLAALASQLGQLETFDRSFNTAKYVERNMHLRHVRVARQEQRHVGRDLATGGEHVAPGRLQLVQAEPGPVRVARPAPRRAHEHHVGAQRGRQREKVAAHKLHVLLHAVEARVVPRAPDFHGVNIDGDYCCELGSHNFSFRYESRQKNFQRG